MYLSLIVLATEIFFLTVCNQVMFAVDNYLALALVLIIVFSIFIDLVYSKKYNLYKFPILVSVLIRVFFLVLDVFYRDYITLPNSGGDSDSYYNAAVSFSQDISYNNYGGMFVKLMGFLFKLIGTNRIIGQFICILFFVTAILLIVNIFNKLNFSESVKKTTLGIVCLLPNFAIITSLFLREPLMIMLITLSLYFYILFYSSSKYRYLVLAICVILIGSLFHAGCCSFGAGYVASLLIFDFKNHKFKFSFINIIFCILMCALFLFLYLNYSDIFFKKFSNVFEVSDIANSSIKGGSSYAQYVGNSSSITNMILFTIPRMVFFITSPLPFQWRGISDVFAFLFDSLYFIYAIYCSVRCFKDKKYQKILFLMYLVIIPALIVFGGGVANTGTALRHRTKFTLIFSIFIALGFNIKTNVWFKLNKKNKNMLKKN